MQGMPRFHSLHFFQKTLLHWFQKNQRDLPWRKTKNPYPILLSEIMLQQTQVLRVIPYYHQFLQKFPSILDAANASSRDVILLWKGLGYNRRALYFHRLCQRIAHHYNGQLPKDGKILQSLPGIGPYTAQAIAVFAFRQPGTCLDTNSKRVLHRFFFGPNRPKINPRIKQFFEKANSIAPKRRSWEWNHGLMDFGSLVCGAKRPLCRQCPLAPHCKARSFFMDGGKNRRLYVKRRAEPAPVSEPKTPNRIFRGRIVKLLCSSPTHSFNPQSIGQLIKRNYSPNDREWLDSILHSLQKDGLLQMTRKKNAIFVSLP